MDGRLGRRIQVFEFAVDHVKAWGQASYIVMKTERKFSDWDAPQIS